MTIDRYSIICFGYGSQFMAYGIILGLIGLVGGFTKSDGNDSFSIVDSSWYANVDCSPVVETWFTVYLGFVPFAVVVSGLVAKFRAKGRFTRSSYVFETFRRQYTILTDKDVWTNAPIICLDVINIVWALSGTIINYVAD